MATLLQRGISSAVHRAMSETPVVIVEGGRAVGKSTMCRMVAAEHGWPSVLDLSDPGLIDTIRLDPLRVLGDLPSPAIIDEAQLLPELTVWVKRIVDGRQGAPGQFILTGSARLGRDQLGGSDPLAGRSIRLRMWSLTPSELDGVPDVTAAKLFDIDRDWRTAKREWKVTDGQFGSLPGLPGVLSNAGAASWERSISSYIESVIPLGVATTRVDQSRLLRAFRYVAANPGQQLNLDRMANELTMKAATARSYIEALEACFLLFRAEAHRPSEHRVLTAHPRLFATDVGLAAWAGRLSDRSLSATEQGGLFENQIAHAIAATTDWTPERIVLRHWRDERAKREVDLLLVHPDGRTLPIEVKSTVNPTPDLAAGVVTYAESNPDAFARGVLVHCGRQVIDFTPRTLPRGSILAIPAASLLGLSSA
jgi:uncharacterized protein